MPENQTKINQTKTKLSNHSSVSKRALRAASYNILLKRSTTFYNDIYWKKKKK